MVVRAKAHQATSLILAPSTKWADGHNWDPRLGRKLLCSVAGSLCPQLSLSPSTGIDFQLCRMCADLSTCSNLEGEHWTYNRIRDGRRTVNTQEILAGCMVRGIVPGQGLVLCCLVAIMSSLGCI